jgi:hypothetical protein
LRGRGGGLRSKARLGLAYRHLPADRTWTKVAIPSSWVVLALGEAARISIEAVPLQHPDRGAVPYPLPALKEKAQLALRKRIDTPLLQRQRFFKRALGARSPFPTIAALTPRAIHGEEKSGSGDLRCKDSEVEEVSSDQI